ncbi:CU044_2847 family protein [Streptomyces sp. NPDC059506]|uniref:CU044_2847 family protein n=1 Tax=unclassified Streptomyces TaxID=2593676 RepID=UPI000CB06DD1|nr:MULTISPECIES: CU044_2847 family protein [unclassified Streptomyces]MCZ2526251.1 CU044_2847 family protein [Streptomyces sp. HB2AG]PLW73403.1 hypothetical protein C0036_07430 [Streptomyces sp. DJ]QMV23573.1 hypothetical protein GQS52_19370 [Streptomyces sp. SCUT-3]
MRTVEFPLEDGGAVLVRLQEEPWPDSVVTRGVSGAAAVEQAERTFESAMDTVRDVARSVAARVRGFPGGPDELVVEFGVEMSAKAGAVVTAVGASAQLKVSLKWQAPPKQQAPQQL